MDAALGDHDALVLPTLPGIAPLRNTSLAEIDDFRGRAMSLLCVAGLARLPQLSLPLATLDGCPLGMSLVAARNIPIYMIAAAPIVALPVTEWAADDCVLLLWTTDPLLEKALPPGAFELAVADSDTIRSGCAGSVTPPTVTGNAL